MTTIWVVRGQKVNVLAGVLGSREAGPVYRVEVVIRLYVYICA